MEICKVDSAKMDFTKVDFTKVVAIDINKRIHDSFGTDIIDGSSHITVNNTGGFDSVMTYVAEKHFKSLVPFIKKMLMIKKMNYIHGTYCIIPALLTQLFDVPFVIKENKRNKLGLAIEKSGTYVAKIIGDETNVDCKIIDDKMMISFEHAIEIIGLVHPQKMRIYGTLCELYDNNLDNIINAILKNAQNDLTREDYDQFHESLEKMKRDMKNGFPNKTVKK